jgi:hypothetical protein
MGAIWVFTSCRLRQGAAVVTTFHPSCTAEFVSVVDGHRMLVAGMDAVAADAVAAVVLA